MSITWCPDQSWTFKVTPQSYKPERCKEVFWKLPQWSWKRSLLAAILKPQGDDTMEEEAQKKWERSLALEDSSKLPSQTFLKSMPPWQCRPTNPWLESLRPTVGCFQLQHPPTPAHAGRVKVRQDKGGLSGKSEAFKVIPGSVCAQASSCSERAQVQHEKHKAFPSDPLCLYPHLFTNSCGDSFFN